MSDSEKILDYIWKNDIDNAKKMIEKDTSLLQTKFWNGKSLLSEAIIRHNGPLELYLIVKGIDIHGKDDDGWNALHHMAFADTHFSLELLVEMNIDINVRDNNGFTPIMIAVMAHSSTFAEALLQYKPDLDCVSEDGNTVHSLLKHTPEMKHLFRLILISKEPEFLAKQDDLMNPIDYEDIQDGQIYAFGINKTIPYILGLPENIKQMRINKFRGSTNDMVFNIVMNKLVPIDDIYYCRRHSAEFGMLVNI